jgi:hypothetical protein
MIGGPRAETPSHTLYLSSVPANQNTIHALLKFFKKYGHIQSIWASGTHAAICFLSPESAKQAFEDPDPFLNNRFVKIYFHRQPRKSECNLEQYINRDLIDRKCTDVERQIASKLREQDEIQSSMLEQRKTRVPMVPEALQTVGTVEQLKSRKSELVMEASRVITEQLTAGKSDPQLKERLTLLRRLIDETQTAINEIVR